jgi:transposase, IS6 family
VQVVTDRAPVYPRVIDDLLSGARHVLEQYANNAVEADHGRLKARLRPMRGLKMITSLSIVAAGHAFVQNLRRGHYELTADRPVHDRVRGAFTKLQAASDRGSRVSHTDPQPSDRSTQQRRRDPTRCE